MVITPHAIWSCLHACLSIGSGECKRVAVHRRCGEGRPGLKAAGDDAGALAAYQEAVRADPTNAPAHNELGTLLFQGGRSGEAIAEFKRATECDPSYALAYYNYAFSSRKAGRFQEAVGAYQRYEQLKPEDPDAKFGLAESLHALGRNAEAVQAYEAYAAQETRPSEQAWVEKAKALAQQLRVQPAAPQSAAPSLVPPPVAGAAHVDPSAAAMTRGDAALSDRRPTDAARAYQEAVRGNPQSAMAHFKLGVAYAELNFLPAGHRRMAAGPQDRSSEPGRAG